MIMLDQSADQSNLICRSKHCYAEGTRSLPAGGLEANLAIRTFLRRSSFRFDGSKGCADSVCMPQTQVTSILLDWRPSEPKWFKQKPVSDVCWAGPPGGHSLPENVFRWHMHNRG